MGLVSIRVAWWWCSLTKLVCLTVRAVGQYRFHDIALTCQRCGKGFEVGEVVVSKKSRSRYIRTKLYHPVCWEGLFY